MTTPIMTLVPVTLAESLLTYLNKRPREESDAMWVALRGCKTVNQEQYIKMAQALVAPPPDQAPDPSVPHEQIPTESKGNGKTEDNQIKE